MINRIKINSADVILENFKVGQGKIIISDLQFGSWSFYWGAMGSSIEEFLTRIDNEYFANKLCSKPTTFDAKASVSNVRKHIRENIPHYSFMSAQKEMRIEIKKLEKINSEEEFVSSMINLPESIMCYDLSYPEEKEFKSLISDIFTNEPWFFIETKPSKEYNYLVELLKALKTKLKN